MSAPVYLMPELAEANPVPGLPLAFEGPEVRHAATVRRTRVGELLDVCDGKGLRARCEVLEVGKNRIDLRVLDLVDEGEPAPRRILVQALAKGGRDEQAVETCSEFGVHSVIPWAAERCISSWKGKQEKGRARWEATAAAAAKQSRRSWVPTIGEEAVTTERLAELVGEAAGRGALVLVCHEEGQMRLAQLVAERAEGEETWIIVGPEGGITDDELEMLEAAGAHRVRLTDTVLRSATAGAWALAALEALRGRVSV